MNEDREPIRYVWTVRSLPGETTPVTGTLAEYARACEMSDITGDQFPSARVWEANADGGLNPLRVKIERGPVTEEHRIPMTFSVPGESVLHMADGAA